MKRILFGMIALLFVACGDNDFSSVEEPQEPNTYASYEDLPNCTVNREGVVVLVEDEKSYYQCSGRRWSFSEMGVDTVEVIDDLSNCTAKYEGLRAYVEKEKSVYTCTDGEWVVTQKPILEIDTEDDLPNCTAAREGDTARVLLDSSIYVCLDGGWEVIYAPMKSVKTKDNLPKCEGALEGDTIYVEADSAKSVCVDKVWYSLGKSIETEEDLMNCTAKREGMSVYVEELQQSLTCKDGEWVEYSPYPSEVTTSYLNQDMLKAGKYGELLDTRDNQVYRTITIGKKTWMAQNLNYDYVVPEETTTWCYEGKSSNCEKYGRLYDWRTATKACPSGWRLPVTAELYDLATLVVEKGGDLRSAEWDGGKDTYGFSAIAAGQRNLSGFGYKDAGAYFWSSGTDSGEAVILYVYGAENAVVTNGNMNYGFSVRCVKN
ncbi:MAG: hypothetical protein MJY78_10785 [Fibrobacter sp.]|nr:hypothetical protein [Fibrobacter sp.]